MLLSFFLLPVIFGYWVLTRTYYTRSRTLRESGHHLFFKSVMVGAALMLLARLTAFSALILFPSMAGEGRVLWKTIAPFPYSGTIAIAGVFGFLLPFVFNRIWSDLDAFQRVAAEEGSGIELLISEAMIDTSLVEITLDNNKTYIGFPLQIGMLSRSGKSDVSMLPILSGYRHPKTRELKTTTDYTPIIERLRADEDASEEDFRVVVPATAIVSARPFSIDLFNEFNPPPTAAPPPALPS